MGPHNDHFWHLFGQLKADYLHHHAQLAARGVLFGGRQGLHLAEVAEQARDVRTAVLVTIARDRMAPLPAPQQVLLEAYMTISAASAAAAGSQSQSADVGGLLSPAAAAETRALLAERAEKRRLQQQAQQQQGDQQRSEEEEK